MENKKIEYKKRFFVNKILECSNEISQYLNTNNTKYYTEILLKLNNYKEISIKDELDALIDNFIGISNLLSFVQNEQIISEVEENKDKDYIIPKKA